MFINTVDNHKSKYTIMEYSNAVLACSLRNIIVRCSTSDFIKYTEQNMIPKFPITKANILHTQEILGQR